MLLSFMQAALKSLSVSLGSGDTKFSAALGTDKRISVTGTVKSGAPYLTRIGTFDMDLSLAGIILLVSAVMPHLSSFIPTTSLAL